MEEISHKIKERRAWSKSLKIPINDKITSMVIRLLRVHICAHLVTLSFSIQSRLCRARTSLRQLPQSQKLKNFARLAKVLLKPEASTSDPKDVTNIMNFDTYV